MILPEKIPIMPDDSSDHFETPFVFRRLSMDALADALLDEIHNEVRNGGFFHSIAGTTTALNNGTNITNEYYDVNMFKLGRTYYNMKDGKGGYEYTTVVGCYLPNEWGLYDMHGNAREYCLDWHSENIGEDPVTDPLGPETGYYRVLRSGSYYFGPKECRSAFRSHRSRSDNYNNDSGFRAVLVP